jgi:hypothetical protein
MLSLSPITYFVYLDALEENWNYFFTICNYILVAKDIYY